jgi:Flp pilus assembly protein TadG
MLGLHLSGKRLTSTWTRVRPRSGVKKMLAIFGEERGQSLVEFALVIPILLIIAMGIITFAIAFWNQLTLTHATSSAAQVAMVQRSTVAVDVCNPVNAALYNAATGINNPASPAPLKFSIATSPPNSTATPTPLITNVAVNSAGVSACPTLLTQGEVIQVSSTYGCNLNFFGFRRVGSCTLNASTTEAVE